MKMLFAETLRRLRTERGLSQRELAERMFVTRSAVVRWENGSRLPDAAMITRLSNVLNSDIGTLLSAASQSDESPNVILVDDSRVIVSDSLSVLEEVLPAAVITGFIRPMEAIEYARTNPIVLAIVDIELGTVSGFDLARRLLEINHRTNIIFLTAYPDYALDAWETEAGGFIVKPLTPEKIRAQLRKLRYPFATGGSDESEQCLRQQQETAQQQWEAAEQRRKIALQQMEIARQRASVMVLQMRPHFIYNTMMSIYSLCGQDPRKARQVIMDFTDYLRKNFNAVASEDTIPFSAELEHTRAYLAVEQAQYEDMLQVDFDTQFSSFRLPPLTLQPVAENAVKHGMNSSAGPLLVSIRTSRTDSAGVITVEDNGPGFDESKDFEPHEALENIRQRLELMCGGTLEIAPREEGGTRVTITIPLSGNSVSGE